MKEDEKKDPGPKILATVVILLIAFAAFMWWLSIVF